MKKRFIYSLRCPFTNEVHYIGKTTKGMTRPLCHLKKSHSEKIQQWVEELKIFGQKPLIDIICFVSETEDIDSVEQYHILKYLEKGCYLLNAQSVKPLSILPNLDKEDKTGIDNISNFLKTRRKNANLTQEEFAEYSGVALTVVRKLEQGKANVNLNSLITLLSMFGCKMDISKIK